MRRPRWPLQLRAAAADSVHIVALAQLTLTAARSLYGVLLLLLTRRTGCVAAGHIVDSSSFPLVVPHTNLSVAAYHPSQRYSRTDVETIVKAATERGIRVVPEFDMPAHMAPAWCVGEPELCRGNTTLDPSSSRLHEVI